MRGLYESLLGGIDNIANEIDSDVLLKPDGELVSQGTDFRSTNTIYLQRAKHDQNQSIFKNGKLTLAVSRYELNKDSKPLSSFFSSIEEFTTPGQFITHSMPVNPDTICKSITCGEYIYRCSWNAKQNPLSNIEINISKDFGKLNTFYGRSISHCLFDITGPNPHFSDVVINFDDKLPDVNKVIIFANDTLHDLHGIKSNAKMVKFHDTFAIEDENKVGKFADLFDWSWVCPTYDSQKGTEVMRPIKNWKTLVATLNNPKRYRAANHNFFMSPKKGAKLSDFFNLSGFKNLKRIEMWNNNVSILITNDKEVLKANMKFWSNNPREYDFEDIPKFDDGWWIIGGKTR